MRQFTLPQTCRHACRPSMTLLCQEEPVNLSPASECNGFQPVVALVLVASGVPGAATYQRRRGRTVIVRIRVPAKCPYSAWIPGVSRDQVKQALWGSAYDTRRHPSKCRKHVGTLGHQLFGRECKEDINALTNRQSQRDHSTDDGTSWQGQPICEGLASAVEPSRTVNLGDDGSHSRRHFLTLIEHGVSASE